MSQLQPLARPMDVGDMLDQAIRLYRKNFSTMIGIVAVIAVPLLAIQIVAAVFALPTDLFALEQRGTSAQSILPMLIFVGAFMITSTLGAIGNVFQTGA